MKEEMIKISMPLIDDIELQRIDTFYNDIVDEYTKNFIAQKDQLITQRLMKNLREENKSLQSQLKAKEEVIKEANNRINKAIDEIDKLRSLNGDFKGCKNLLEILSKGIKQSRQQKPGVNRND